MFLYEGNEQYSFYKSNGDKVFLSSTDLFMLKDFLRDEILVKHEEKCQEDIRDLTSNFKHDLDNIKYDHTNMLKD